jgi:hypothetical protein
LSPGRIKNFHFSISSRPALGPTQSPIQWVVGAVSPGVKWQGREADHSPPTSAKVKKTTCYYSLQITITHRLASRATFFTALLGNIFQQWMFFYSHARINSVLTAGCSLLYSLSENCTEKTASNRSSVVVWVSVEAIT